ncbi:MAG: DNA polymerase III subunit chi [Sandarakinorhabdus sp.]|nr:DNA polymerase III subunit chi [Sandarakinorhabdus sp.]
MIDIGFYQLAQRRVEAVLPPLVTRALSAGHRVLIRSSDAAVLTTIDAALWSHAPDGFIPHGIDLAIGPERAASQPVLLTRDAPITTNAADCLAQVGDDLPDDLTGLTRLFFLFDADNLEIARARWRVLNNAAGVRPVYWRESDAGRFEKAG